MPKFSVNVPVETDPPKVVVQASLQSPRRTKASKP
jgi:hypothetical protein